MSYMSFNAARALQADIVALRRDRKHRRSAITNATVPRVAMSLAASRLCSLNFTARTPHGRPKAAALIRAGESIVRAPRCPCNSTVLA
jgi:hypothetical protein